MADLLFNEASHEYRKGGVVVPHVTGIIGFLTDYSMVNPEQLEIARQKGVAVHKMVEADAKNELADLPDWMIPVYDYWLKVKREAGLEIIASERKVYHPTYRYAGTLDLRVIAHNLKLKGHGIIDVKRSFMAGNAIGLQTAAYANADDASGNYAKTDRIQWRAALRLREDMQPRFQYYDDKNDFSNFLACLTVKRLKEQFND